MSNASSVSAEDRGGVSERDDVQERTLAGAIAKLASLHDGDLGLIDVLACGRAAVAPLYTFLFKRERSGIYEPRCRAARALGLLGAYDVLREFLALRREIADPAERTGEDAAINAAARALASAKDGGDFPLLLDVLHWRILPGVIEAVGAFERAEAIPLLIGALVEDDCRLAAEAALRRLGRGAEPALVSCATAEPDAPGRESDGSRRQRRAALNLLLEMGISAESWEKARQLIDDPDAKIAVLACKLGLITPNLAGEEHALERLADLREHSDWMISEDIESFLAAREVRPGRQTRY